MIDAANVSFVAMDGVIGIDAMDTVVVMAPLDRGSHHPRDGDGDAVSANQRRLVGHG